MHAQDLHLQRLLDGRLSPAEAAGMSQAASHDPGLGSRLSALSRLDQDLLASSRPLTAERHQALLSTIAERLPHSSPPAHARISPSDVIVVAAVLGMIAVCTATAGNVMRGSPLLLAMACIGVVSGMLILVLAVMVRHANRSGLARLLGNRISLGPSDLLIYRTIGIGLALGGIYLAHLA